MSGRDARLDALLSPIDPRVRDRVVEDLHRWRPQREALPQRRVVLVGHRAAGKSALLPTLAGWSRRRAIDLDAEIERRSGESIARMYVRDAAAFRSAERATFESLPRRGLVAAGGGFVAHHRDLLADCLAVLVPISFETYCERLRADATRPRLRPELSLEAELEQVFQERDRLHEGMSHWSLGRFLAALIPPLRVVTLPPRAEAIAFAREARRRGADLLELRTDLHDAVDAAALARQIGLLVSERGSLLPGAWVEAASWIDRPLSPGAIDASIVSFHSGSPFSPDEAEAQWRDAKLPDEALVKHVEPLGDIAEAGRLFETQRRLSERFGADRVTVLATGALALPFRCALSSANALDYLALDASWSAAPGQRLLDDAVRAVGRSTRRGILGTQIVHSRSPRVHRQPFDRIALPEDAPLEALLDALRPHYDGFAVTSPFKKIAAAAVKAPFPAINTLVRRSRGWDAFNTDVDGAAAVLARLGEGPVTVLGDGGATAALRIAAANARRPLVVLRRGEASPPVEGLALWTWPAEIDPPAGLRFARARVGVIGYGAPGRRVADRIVELGGIPVRLGATWFVAQARGQQRLWEGSGA